MKRIPFRRFNLMSIAVLFMLMASTVMLRAQEMDEKFAWTTQMFLNELKEQPKQPGNGPRRAPRHRFDDGMMKRKDRRVIARPDTVGGMAYISCFIHLKNVNDLSAVRSLGVQVEETFDNLNFITARVPVKNLEKLADIDNVTRIKVAQQMRPLTDVARQKTNVDDLLTQSADATAAGIATKYDGTGVILGIIDTGIDFQHIAFKDKNGNSRIKRAYVQTGATGTEYTSVSSLTTDDNTNDHGTHTASTAGGSSVIVSGSTISVTDDHANATYGGMAPGADLYLAGVVLYDTYIINALTKMVQYANAQNKPLVVSNSWGSQEGPHDGTGEIAEVVAQYFGDSHPNHIILFASSNDAGHSLNNEGGGFFVKKNSASSSYPLGTILRSSRYNNCDGGDYYQGTISTAWSSTPLNCKIHVLNDATGAVLKSWTVTSSTTSFSGLDTYYNGTLTVAKGTDNGKYYLQVYSNGLESLNETTTTQNGKTYYNSAYTLAIEVYPSSGSANVNMWANNWSFFSNLLTTSGHTWIAGSDDMCVSDEATIPEAISIGAYVSKTDWRASSGSSYSSSNIFTMGDIAGFSSYATAAQSPTGQAYPWICAPGARLAAGVNHYHNTSVDDYNYYGNYSDDLVVNNSSSPYAMMEGTSMATPVAAGIVALWLQAAKSMNKNLTVSDVKNIMSQTAINDSYTTAGSNASHFGKGKIDALAGIQYIYDMQSTSEGSSGTWSGNTLTIGGNATSSGYYVPYYNSFKYSTVQMLYTPTEIGKSGTISSIAFKVAKSASLATSEVKIYLGHKSSNFSGSSDYVTSSNLTLVYSGSPTLGATTGWETLTFNQGTFNYNGTDNLVVVVTRKSDNWTTALKYYLYQGSGYTLYRRSDDDATYGNVTNTSSSYSTSTDRPAIQMVFAASSTSTPTSINLNDTSVSLEMGKTKQLTATVLPSGASQSVTWSVVSGSSVASVSSSGLVTAKAAGTATIRATSTVNSTVYKDCTVTVTEPQLQPGTWSGDTLTIGGNATDSSPVVPYYNSYKYSTVQMLYTPTEIGKSGTISSIAFKVANSASFATSEVKVYLGHKSSKFSGTGDYVTSSNLTLVYSGSPTLGATTGWETLTFNQGTFNYNGTDNLVVVVTRKSDNWTYDLKYYYYTGSGYTLYRRSDDYATYGDVTNTSSSYSTSTNRPAIQMVIESTSSLEPGSWSGNTLTIGGNTIVSNNGFPYINWQRYSTVQMLYTPTEIGKSGTINSIAFKVASISPLPTQEVKVYLGHKSGYFSSGSDYVTSSNLTLVYSGSPTLGATTGWETLTFNQGTFNYNGTDNLVVVVTKRSESRTSDLKYYYYTGSVSTLFRRSDDDATYGDVTNTSSSYYTSTNRPAIQMVFAEQNPIVPTDISQLDNAIYVIESYEGVRSGRMNLSVRIKNSVTAEGFDFDLILPTGFSVAYTPEGKIDAELSGERADENALRLLEPELSADGRSLHISASPANKDAFISGNDGEVMIVGVMVDANVSIGEHSVTVMDAEIHDREATYPHINKVQSSITVCDKTLGDANGNGNFNGADYTSILHYLWDRPDPSFVMSAADVNCDGYISVSDLTAWIYLYLNRKNATQSAPQKCVPQVRIPE